MTVAKLHYRRRGRGDPLLLLHGFLGGSGYWVPTLNYLSSYFDVIALDLPGFAASRNVAPFESVDGFAASLMAFLDTLGIDRFAVVGHSMGGEIALQAALGYPTRIERMVLYGAPSSGELRHRFETVEQSIARVQSEGLDAAADTIVRSWFRDGDAHPFYPMCRAAGRGVSADTAIKVMTAVTHWDVTERLNELSMPILIIGGEHDRSVGLDEFVALRKAIRGAKLAVIPGCAHNVHLEKPDLFNRVVAEFLLAAH